jgi:hypothetical protein
MIHHPLPCYIRVTVKLARKSVLNEFDKYFSKNSAVKCPSYENADKVRQAVNG